MQFIMLDQSLLCEVERPFCKGTFLLATDNNREITNSGFFPVLRQVAPLPLNGSPYRNHQARLTLKILLTKGKR